MDLHQAILSRRTVHAYSEQPVAAEIIDRALNAARWAPNHKLTHPWRFYVMGERSKDEVAAVAAALAEESLPNAGVSRLTAVREQARRKIEETPVLIVATSRCSDDPFREREDYAATACAIQNLQLSFWAQGVGAKWSTGAVTRDTRIYGIIGARPETDSIVGFIKAGYPSSIPDMKRKPLHELVIRLP